LKTGKTRTSERARTKKDPKNTRMQAWELEGIVLVREKRIPLNWLRGAKKRKKKKKMGDQRPIKKKKNEIHLPGKEYHGLGGVGGL